ncbi:MAG: ABC transporter permease, partial [Rectinemataceae bacterium]
MKNPTLDRTALRNFLSESAVVLILGVFVLFMIASKPSFYTWGNIANILTEFSVYGITACAMTVAIICGEFDLSASAVFAWSTILFVSMVKMFGLAPAMAITIVSGAAWGILNGFLVARMKMSAFIVTLATMTIAQGLAFFYTNGVPINTSDEALLAIGNFRVVGLSLTTLVFAVVLVLFALVLRKTRFGRNIYATGGNIEVARLAGINVTYYKFIIFVILGVCAALSAIMFSTRIRAGSALYGRDLSLYCVAATVIGGTSLSGGNGGVIKTLVGLLV